jgi:hypothetical protein
MRLSIAGLSLKNHIGTITLLQIDPNDFRRLYDSLSDEALLAVKREDLTEIARQYYDLELAQRGLENEQNSVDPKHPMAPNEDLVPVGTFQSGADAGFARSLLAAAEIPTFSENEARQAGKLFGISESLQIYVPRSFEEQAREVLGAELSDDELAAQAEAAALTEDSEFEGATDTERPDGDE